MFQKIIVAKLLHVDKNKGVAGPLKVASCQRKEVAVYLVFSTVDHRGRHLFFIGSQYI